MKRVISLVMAFLLLMGLTGTAAAESGMDSLEMLAAVGQELNSSLELGAGRIYWQWFSETNDPGIDLLAVATTNNGKSIVLAGGSSIPFETVKVLPTEGKKGPVPETIGELITVDEHIVAQAYDGNLADGCAVISAGKVLAWFDDDNLCLGEPYRNGREIKFGCTHLYDPGTKTLRMKKMHQSVVVKAVRPSEHKDGYAITECQVCGNVTPYKFFKYSYWVSRKID